MLLYEKTVHDILGRKENLYVKMSVVFLGNFSMVAASCLRFSTLCCSHNGSFYAFVQFMKL